MNSCAFFHWQFHSISYVLNRSLLQTWLLLLQDLPVELFSIYTFWFWLELHSCDLFPCRLNTVKDFTYILLSLKFPQINTKIQQAALLTNRSVESH